MGEDDEEIKELSEGDLQTLKEDDKEIEDKLSEGDVQTLGKMKKKLKNTPKEMYRP